MRESLEFIIRMPSVLMHGLITMNWLFLRSLSAFFSFNVRLLLVFCRELFIEPNSSFNTCEEAIQDAVV